MESGIENPYHRTPGILVSQASIPIRLGDYAKEQFQKAV
jgi:hypothetical protein